jgi:uncharacterized protein
VCVGWLMAMLVAAVGAPVAPAAAEPEPIRTTDVTFVGGEGVILHGIVVAPRPSGKRRPALVMLEGAGNRGRQELRPAAEVLARHGVMTPPTQLAISALRCRWPIGVVSGCTVSTMLV